MAKILLIEDEYDIAIFVVRLLECRFHTVDWIDNGKYGYDILGSGDYDLAILDIELPGMDGLEVCRHYRFNRGSTPVLVLSGRAQIEDKIQGLNYGADDCLTKPFLADELSARVDALLRRGKLVEADDILTYGNVRLDPQMHSVKVNGREINLLPKEFAIFELLLRHKGKVFSAEGIIDNAWSVDDNPAPDVVRTHIMRLRQKLGDDAIVQTVHGVGYRIPHEKPAEVTHARLERSMSLETRLQSRLA
jgi:DNA-binding response OmpR family regulator